MREYTRHVTHAPYDETQPGNDLSDHMRPLLNQNENVPHRMSKPNFKSGTGTTEIHLISVKM